MIYKREGFFSSRAEASPFFVKAVNFKFTQTGFFFFWFKFFLNVKAFYMIHLYVICYIYKKIWVGVCRISVNDDNDNLEETDYNNGI